MSNIYDQITQFEKSRTTEDRNSKSIYYTPKEVCNFMIKGSDHFLNKYLHKNISEIDVLDPAGGSMIFPIQLIKYVLEKYPNNIDQFISKLSIFEFDKESYDHGVSILKEMLPELPTIIHRDTLDVPNPKIVTFADPEDFKTHTLTIGNPPYNKQKNKEFDSKMSYGVPQSKVDYLRFMKLFEYKAKKTPSNMVSFVVPNTFLYEENLKPVRDSLRSTYNRIYILNCHGWGLGKEKTPDGQTDENLFGITLGICIIFLIKCDKPDSKIFYQDLWGKYDAKIHWLNEESL